MGESSWANFLLLAFKNFAMLVAMGVFDSARRFSGARELSILFRLWAIRSAVSAGQSRMRCECMLSIGLEHSLQNFVPSVLVVLS